MVIYRKSTNETRKGRIMAVITKSFRDFFTKSFTEEKAYRDFGTRHFKLLYEMAQRFHKLNAMPANIDDDDLEFLGQFPHDYWIKAKQARYQMFFDAVKGLHKKRHEEHGQPKLKQAIITAIETGEYGHLQGVIPDRNINQLKRVGTTLSAKERADEAEKLSHDHVKDKTPHIDEPQGEIPFTLKGSSDKTATRKPVTFMAKPFLNRLYHKLETTPGNPFHPESGLNGTGKYGLDMAEPMDSRTIKSHDEDGDETEVTYPNSTAGMKFPTDSQIRDRMIDYFNLNAHRMFGNLPEDAEWKPVPGMQDTWSVGYVRQELQKRIEAQLRVSGKKYEKESEMRKEAADLVKQHIVKMAESGQLKGPPIPGQFPDGIPIKIEGGKLVNPPLYLPYQIKDIKMRDENGGVKVVQKAVPVVKPAHFFRELGSDESDYEHELGDDGQPTDKRKYDPTTGEPVYRVPQEKLRGHERQFVHVGDEEFQKKKHRAAGAIDFNSETEQVMHITKGDPGWQEAWEKAFGDQQKVEIDRRGNATPSNSESGFYEDIIAGINQCFKSSHCGGATHHELEMLKNNIEDFHQIVVIKMLNSMGDPNLYTSSGRKAFAYNKVSSIMQKDLGSGGGTRRKRNLTQTSRNTSFSAGGEKNIEDDLMGQLAGGTGKIRGSKKRGKGDRQFDTSGMNTPYNLTNMREALMQMQKDAQEADSTSDEAKKLSQRQRGTEIINMLRDGIKKQIDFKMYLTDTLIGLYQQGGMGKGEAEQAAQAQMKSWQDEDGHNSSETLMAAFQNHPLVQSAIGAAGEDKKQDGQVQPTDKEDNANEQEAMRFLQSTFDKMQSAGFDEDDIKDKLLAKPGEKYSIFVKQLVAQQFGGINDKTTKLLDRVQGEINRRFKLPSPAAAQAARVVTTPQSNELAKKKLGQTPEAEAKPVPTVAPTTRIPTQQVPIPTESVSELFAKKNWLGLAHHPDYLGTHSPVLDAQKLKLLNHFKTNKDKYQQNEIESAIANLERSIRRG